MVKIFNDISDAHIDNEELARLKVYILVASYLKESLSRFIQVLIKNNNQNEDEVVEKPEVFNSKQEKKNRNIRRKSKLPSVLPPIVGVDLHLLCLLCLGLGLLLCPLPLC